jgi:hypothetical protein
MSFVFATDEGNTLVVFLKGVLGNGNYFAKFIPLSV